MRTFKNFLFEANQPIIGSLMQHVPMSPMVGCFLTGTRQYLLNQPQSSQNESYGEKDPGRKFNYSKGMTDFLSVIPIGREGDEEGGKVGKPGQPEKLGDLAAMAHVLDWIMNAGLMEASLKRANFAKQATIALKEQLGEEEFTRIFRDKEITEDVIYSKKAHAQLPELKQWYEKNAPEANLEPEEEIAIPHHGKKKLLRMSEVNGVIANINQYLEDHNKELGLQVDMRLDELKFAGPDGLIEWIEDGTWAGKGHAGTEITNQPWRTKDGISIHNPHIVDLGGQIANDFGGLVQPLRNPNNGSYAKFLRDHVQELFVETSKLLSPNVDKNKLTPEQRKWLDMSAHLPDKVKFDNSKYSLTQGFASSHQKQGKDFEIDQADEYAGYYILLTMGREFIGEVNSDYEDLTDKGVNSKQAIELLAAKYRLEKIGSLSPTTIISNIISIRSRTNQPSQSGKGGWKGGWWDRVHYRLDDPRSKERGSFSRDDYNKNLGLNIKEDPFSGGSAHIGGGIWKELPVALNYGHAYLRYLVSKGTPLNVIVKQFGANEWQNKLFGVATEDGVAQFLQDSLDATKNPINISALKQAVKTNFGRIVDPKDSNAGVLKSNSEIEELVKNDGWSFEPLDRQGQSLPNGADRSIKNAIRGKLSRNSRSIDMKRDNANVAWRVFLPELLPSEPGEEYQNTVPLLAPGVGKWGGQQGKRFNVGHATVKSSLTSKSNLTEDMKVNPQKYGFGLVNREDLSSLEGMCRKRAGRLIGMASKKDPRFMKYLSFEGDTQGLARELEGSINFIKPGPKFYFGDLLGDEPGKAARTIDDVKTYMSEKGDNLPGIEDSQVLTFWINRMKNAVRSSGTKLEPVPQENYDDFNYWKTQRLEKIPQKIYNAFLIAGAQWRMNTAISLFSREIDRGKDKEMGDDPMGKEGERMDRLDQVSNDDMANTGTKNRIEKGVTSRSDGVAGGKVALTQLMRQRQEDPEYHSTETGSTINVGDTKNSPMAAWRKENDGLTANWSDDRSNYMDTYRDAKASVMANGLDAVRSINSSDNYASKAYIDGVADGVLNVYDQMKGNREKRYELVSGLIRSLNQVEMNRVRIAQRLSLQTGRTVTPSNDNAKERFERFLCDKMIFELREQISVLQSSKMTIGPKYLQENILPMFKKMSGLLSQSSRDFLYNTINDWDEKERFFTSPSYASALIDVLSAEEPAEEPIVDKIAADTAATPKFVEPANKVAPPSQFVPGQPIRTNPLASKIKARMPQLPQPPQTPKESYSFKEKVLRKFREMVGTGAVMGTNPKHKSDATYQVWGKPGAGNALIDGDVDTAQSDPDGTKGKRGRKRK